jgi:gamma-glutamylputrescine oxidase
LHSLWQTEVTWAAPPCEGNQHADIAVVGAGLSGSWLAYWLREYGGRVVVLEREQPAAGASGRNAGFVLAGPADLYAETVDRFGRDHARDLLDLSRQNREALARVAAASPDDLGFRPSGSLYLAVSDEADLLTRSVALLQADGVPARLMEPDDWPPALDRSAWALGARFPEDGQVHPARLVHRLLTLARDAGVTIYGESPVTAVHRDGAGWRLDTPRGPVFAERVVLTVNAWLPGLWPDLSPYVRPVRGQVLATAPIAPLYDMPVYADHGYLYWRQRPDGRLIVGGYRHLDPSGEVGYELRLHPGIQSALETLAVRLAGRPVTVAARWAGIMAFTPDHVPLVDEVAPGLFVAGGYSGHGVALAGAVGRLLAARLKGTGRLPAILSVARLTPRA